MANSNFPQRKSQGSQGLAGGQSSQLDAPPPSPAGPPPGGMPLSPGGGMAPPMPSFGEMAQPLTAGTPGRAVAPEIAVGMMESATTIYGLLDSFASIAPDLAADFALQKDLLQRTMAKLMVNSGQPGSPSSTGANFPGGGFLSGMQ